MTEDHDSVKQLGFEMGGRSRVQLDGVAFHGDSVLLAGLVELFHAIDDRSALKGNPPTVLADSGIRLEQMRRHIEAQLNPVVGGPAAADGQILACAHTADFVTIHLHTALCRPSGDANVHNKLTRS